MTLMDIESYKNSDGRGGSEIPLTSGDQGGSGKTQRELIEPLVSARYFISHVGTDCAYMKQDYRVHFLRVLRGFPSASWTSDPSFSSKKFQCLEKHIIWYGTGF